MAGGAEAQVNVNFRANGIEGVRRGMALVGSSADATAQKFGMASRQMAMGLETVARTGKVAGEGLRQVVAQGAEMAFMFGAGGPIVGALGILGLAFFNVFKRARDEMEQTRIKAIEELERMTRAGDVVGLKALIAAKTTGEVGAIRRPGESDEEWRARSQGSRGVQSRISTIQGMLATRVNERGQTLTVDESIAGPLRREMNRLIELRGELVAAAAMAQRQLATAQGVSDAAYAGGLSPILGPGRTPGVSGGIPGVSTSGNRFGDMVGSRPMSGMSLGDSAILPLRPDYWKQMQIQVQLAFQKNFAEPMRDMIEGGFAEGLGASITAAFTSAFSGGGISGALQAFGRSALGALGGIFSQMGQAWISYGVIAKSLVPTLLNPITSGGAAIAIGAALVALGATLSTIGQGRGGGGGGGSGSAASAYSSASVIDRGLINPASSLGGVNARQPVTVYATIIGKNDPNAQRDLMAMITAAQRRGL